MKIYIFIQLFYNGVGDFMKVYQKDHQESYCLGVFGTIELLKNKPEHCTRVILSSKAEKNNGTPVIQELCQKHQIPIEVNDKAVSKLSKKDNCYAIGVFTKYQEPLNASKNHVVLVNPMDMGNLGTMIRTMIGFGVKDLAIIRPAADIYDPKVVRASMGALFRLRFHYYESFEEYLSTAGNHHVYSLMLKGAKRLDQVAVCQPYSVVFGNESSGLPDAFLSYGQSILIHHSDEIDSLNLSMALGITLYQFNHHLF